MDDTWKILGGVFFGLLTIHASLEPRARRAAERQVEEAFLETGKIQGKVEPRGMFGLFANDLWSVDIYGSGVQANDLPFRLYPKGGWKGSIRHLRLRLTDFELKGLPVRRLEADVPFVKYDLGHALYKNRLHFRAAGVGPAEVQVGAEGLRAFALRKYAQTLSDVKVAFDKNRVTLSGLYRFLGDPSPIVVSGRIQIREGRYLDVVDPDVQLSGLPLTKPNAERLLKNFNPLLDIETDLGLRGFFTMTEVKIGDDSVTLRGRMTIPKAEEATDELPPNASEPGKKDKKEREEQWER